MAEKIGEFIHRKLKAKGLKDEETAGFLNISPSTLRKYFPLDDMYISRLIEFSKLLGEDVISEYYYPKEPLKSLREQELQTWNKKINELKQQVNDLKEQGASKDNYIEQLQDHLNTQKELINTLKKDIARLESSTK